MRLICVGKLKERFYTDAAGEYAKRLGGYCKLEIIELAEARLPDSPTEGEIGTALTKEASAIEARLLKGGAVIALCIEGKEYDSAGFSGLLHTYAGAGMSRLNFVIGGSFGLHPRVKERSGLLLSMSKMTFPHNLARIMLLEQLYRGFKIAEGGKYHK